jgi:hypothetical protein
MFGGREGTEAAMTPEHLVALFKAEKESLLDMYVSRDAQTAVSKRIEGLNLSPEQGEQMKEILSEVLTDAFYTILLGLDGCAQIGGKQIEYQLTDEEGNQLTGAGRIEALAWEAFHGK